MSNVATANLKWIVNMDILHTTPKINGRYVQFKIAPRFNFYYLLEISDNSGIIYRNESINTVDEAKALSEVWYERICGA